MCCVIGILRMNLLCCYHPWPKQVSHLYKEAFESVKDCDCSSSRFYAVKVW